MSPTVLFARCTVLAAFIVRLSTVLCDERCLEVCHYENDTMKCEVVQPTNWIDCECTNGCLSTIRVPCFVTKVIVQSSMLITLWLQRNFSFHESWLNVTSLAIYTQLSDVFIQDDAFSPLKSLRSLRIDTSENGICSLNSMIFHGLDHLVNLHLTGMTKCFKFLMFALGEQAPLRNVRSITLERQNKIGFYESILRREEHFSHRIFWSLAGGRNLDSLTIAYFDIPVFDLTVLKHFGSYIRKFSLIQCTINYLYIVYNSNVNNLDVISFEGTLISNWSIEHGSIVTLQSPSFRMLVLLERYDKFKCPKYNLLDLHTLQKCHSFKLCVNHSNENDKSCPLRLNAVALDTNFQRVVQWFAKRQDVIDLSSMTINYLSANILPEVVRDLVLSENNLAFMQREEPIEFQRVFSTLYNLQNLNLNKNQLIDLPFTIFLKNTQLVTLHLSGNQLTSFNVGTKQFKRLKLIDLSYNRIQVVDSTAQAIMNQLQLRTGALFEVHMNDNPYVCSCNKTYQESIHWIRKSKFLSSENRQYACELNGVVLNIYKSGASATETYCTRQELYKYLMIVLPPVGVIILFSVIVMVLLRRFIRRKRKFNELVDQIQNEEFPLRYLVFLSFCSEDEDLVMNDIYPRLTDTIADIIKRDFDLVCVGDKDFLPGHPLCDQIINCICDSAVMIAVVSKDFCRKNWCQTEIMEAYQLHKPIVMLVIDHVDRELMGDLLGKIFDRYAHASWVPDNDRGHLVPEWPVFGRAIIELSTTTPGLGRRTIHETVV